MQIYNIQILGILVDLKLFLIENSEKWEQAE